eukprot:scaffold46035_cov54-Attheya_sp.AAC.4
MFNVGSDTIGCVVMVIVDPSHACEQLPQTDTNGSENGRFRAIGRIFPDNLASNSFCAPKMFLKSFSVELLARRLHTNSNSPTVELFMLFG